MRGPIEKVSNFLVYLIETTFAFFKLAAIMLVLILSFGLILAVLNYFPI